MKCILITVMISIHFCALAYSTQRPSQLEEEQPSPFLDIASTLLESFSQNQNNGGGSSLDGIAGIASMIGNMVQSSDGGKSQGSGAAQIIAGLGSLLASSGRGNSRGGFDPSIIGNVIEMFTANGGKRDKRSNEEGGGGLETVLSIASTFLSNYNQNQDHDSIDTNEIGGEPNPYKKEEVKHPGDSLMNLLPIVMQTLSSFSGAEMEKTEQRHKDHQHILPPFLEKIHQVWDNFANSELSDAIYKKIGLDVVFKGFVGRDGKVDYDKLFESLQNQSFRRKWIQKAVMYLADWANYYISNPEVFQNYFATGQLMANGFLQSQGFPKKTHLDIERPSETTSNLINFLVNKYLMVNIDSMPYVKPVVSYAKDILELGKSREYLQKMNTTDLSTKLTDTLNLEIIEPILKVHRAYRHITGTEPRCDQYILCEINSHSTNEKLGLGGFKSNVIKFGSYAASWFISETTKTPFWTLLASVNNPYECKRKHSVECERFHDVENKVTTEYAHTEL